MSFKFSHWFSAVPVFGLLFTLAGCGGGGDTPVASSAPPPAASPAASEPPAESSEQPGDSGAESGAKKDLVSYGGEAGSVGGSSMGGSSMGSGEMGGLDEMGSGSMGSPQMGSSQMSSRPSLGMSGSSPSGSMPSSGAPSGSRPSLGSLGGGMAGAAPGSDEMGSSMMGSGSYGSEPSMGPNLGSGMGSSMMNSSGFGMGSGFATNNSGAADINSVMAFVRQNCESCHGPNNPKGNVSLDRLNRDIASDSLAWTQVAEQLESGQMPPRSAQQPDARVRTLVVNFIRQALNDAGELSFMERAELAASQGDSETAMNLFHAAMVTADDSQAVELANNYKVYVPHPSKAEDLQPASDVAVAVKPRLTTQLKFAVGIILKLGPMVTDVKPVGVKQLGGGGGGGPGGSEGGGFPGMGGGGNNAGSKLDVFEDLTGDVGKAIVAGFEGRRSGGQFGSLFATVKPRNAAPPPPNNANGFGSDGGSSMGGPGGVGTDGEFVGPAGGGMGMGSGSMGSGMGGPNMGGPSAPKRTMPGSDLANGLLYLGKGDNSNDLLKKAIEAGADGLLVIEIDATMNRLTKLVSNDTKFRMMLPSGKVCASSTKTIKNLDLEKAQLQGKDADEVQKQVDLLFNRIDSTFTLIDPKFSAAVAMKQLHQHVHSEMDRLEVLAEARMYQAKGIITAEQLETVYQVILESNDGITLATGSEADRKLVMNPYTESL